MVKHTITFKLIPYPFGGPIASKIIGERVEKRTFFDLTDDEARRRASIEKEKLRKGFGVERCEVTGIIKITEEDIAF